MFQQHTIQELLDELDVIEQYQQLGHQLRRDEMTKNQMNLYKNHRGQYSNIDII